MMVSIEWESTSLEFLKKFFDVIVDIYKTEFLRYFIIVDLTQTLIENNALCFLEMIGSIDCSHWHMKMVLLLG